MSLYILMAVLGFLLGLFWAPLRRGATALAGLLRRDDDAEGRSDELRTAVDIVASMSFGDRTRRLIDVMRTEYRSRPRHKGMRRFVVFRLLVCLPVTAYYLYWGPVIRMGERLRSHLRVWGVVTWIRVRRAVLSGPLFWLDQMRSRRTKVDRSLMAAVERGEIHNVGIFLERGACPSQFERGMSLLVYAMRTRQTEVARLLLEAGADIGVREFASGSPTIMFAASCADVGLARAVLERGADIDASGLTGVTALHGAAVSGDADMVRLLLAHGADPSRRTIDGATALGWARKKHHEEVVQVLLQAASHSDPVSSSGLSGAAERAGQR